MTTASKQPRLVARVPEEIHTLVATAAKVSGLNPTQFIIQAVTEAARRVISESRRIELGTRDAEHIAALLTNPGEPSDSLIAAAKRYRDKGAYVQELHHNRAHQEA